MRTLRLDPTMAKWVTESFQVSIPLIHSDLVQMRNDRLIIIAATGVAIVEAAPYDEGMCGWYDTISCVSSRPLQEWVSIDPIHSSHITGQPFSMILLSQQHRTRHGKESSHGSPTVSSQSSPRTRPWECAWNPPKFLK